MGQLEWGAFVDDWRVGSNEIVLKRLWNDEILKIEENDFLWIIYLKYSISKRINL